MNFFPTLTILLAPMRGKTALADIEGLSQSVGPKLGLSERLNEQEIQAAWREIVGDFLAEHSLPVSMRDGVLIVQVIQPAVRYELERSWKRSILRKLQARFEKTVREVRSAG